MTVQDLIDELSKIDKNLEVGIEKDPYFYESMFLEIRKIKNDDSFVYESEDNKFGENETKKVLVIVCD